MPRCTPQRQSQNTLLPPARISFSASPQNDVLFAISAPTCSTYSCQLFSISSLNSCGRVPSRKPCWRFSGWYTTRSDTSARARRRAFCFGSCTMKGFTGRSGPVPRLPGVLAPPPAVAGGGGGAAGCGVGCGGRGDGGGGAGGGAAARGVVMVGTRAAAGLAGRAGAAGRAIAGAETGGAAGIAGRATDGGAIAGRGGAAGGVRSGGARGTGGAGGAGGAGDAEAAGAGRDAAGGAAATGAPAPSGLIANTLLQTLQRARKPPAGTLAGSTRYTVSHEGHVTFTPRLRFLRRPGRDRAAGRPRTPILPASSRNSSSRSPTH